MNKQILIIGLLIGMLVLSGCEFENSLDSAPNSNFREERCDEICLSHNYIKLSKEIITNKPGFDGQQQNAICYCQDSEGRIWTFVM